MSKSLNETLTRDDQDRIVIGNPSAGCRHCGRVDMKISKNNDCVVYHAGVSCCDDAIRDRVKGWRRMLNSTTGQANRDLWRDIRELEEVLRQRAVS